MTTQTVTIGVETVRVPLQLDTRAFLAGYLNHPLLIREDIQKLIDGFEAELEKEIVVLFIRQVVQPAMVRTRNAALVSIEADAKALLQKLLPLGVDVEAFIDEVDQDLDEDVELELAFQEAAKLICEQGTRESERIERLHTFLRERLFKIIEVKEAESNEAIDKSNEQAVRINAIKAELLKASKEHEQLGEAYKKGRERYQALLQESYDTIRRYKRV